MRIYLQRLTGACFTLPPYTPIYCICMHVHRRQVDRRAKIQYYNLSSIVVRKRREKKVKDDRLTWNVYRFGWHGVYNIMGGEEVKLCFGGLVLCDEWIGDLFEPVYGANQRYCGPAEYGEP